MNVKHGSAVRISLAMLVAAILGVGLLQATSASAAGRGGRGGAGGQVLGPLSAAEIAALSAAIHEEYTALNTYEAVIAQYGAIDPFERIARSERQHADALAGLFTKYAVAVPVNPGLSPVPTWSSLTAACQTGVDAEIADAALYDTLEPDVTHADVLRVFDNLRRASLEHHLPAFETCN